MRRRASNGFVLLMTLALLVLVSTLLITVGRIAIARSLSATRAEDELQRKWGVVSCRTALLPAAEAVLARIEATENRPAKQVSATIALGRQQFSITLCDEQAKANINALLEHRSPGSVENQLRTALSGSGLINTVHLRPLIDDPDAIATTQSSSLLPEQIRSFGQMLTDVSPDRLFGQSGSSPVSDVTCWGSGAVNVMRADEPALELACWPTLSRVEVERIVAARDRIVSVVRSSKISGPRPVAGSNAIGNLLNQAGIDAKAAARLSVTSTSACHSLWIVVKDRQRLWYDLTVTDDSQPGGPRREVFTW